jgi:hypothetical protein
MIDLISIARTEADGGDLFGIFEDLFEPGDVRPEGYPDASPAMCGPRGIPTPLSGRVAISPET